MHPPAAAEKVITVLIIIVIVSKRKGCSPERVPAPYKCQQLRQQTANFISILENCIALAKSEVISQESHTFNYWRLTLPVLLITFKGRKVGRTHIKEKCVIIIQ